MSFLIVFCSNNHNERSNFGVGVALRQVHASKDNENHLAAVVTGLRCSKSRVYIEKAPLSHETRHVWYLAFEDWPSTITRRVIVGRGQQQFANNKLRRKQYG